MFVNSALHQHFAEVCPDIHECRLQALMDVAYSLQKSQSLSLTSMGRHINNSSDIKHKIKKVDRIVGNKHLHQELHTLYRGLSSYLFTYISHAVSVPIVIDLCYMKDDKDIQMLSAEIASRGRTQPIYREVFEAGELSKRAISFINNLAELIPSERMVICIMDAGFHEDWFSAIESKNWCWIARVRKPKSLKFSGDEDWTNIRDFIPEIGEKTKNYDNVLLYRQYSHPCRVVTTRKKLKKKNSKSGNSKNRLVASGSYLRSAQEPWVLASNLSSDYKAAEIVKLYSKRMQIEESFRDLKSPQYGLAGRNIRTKCVHRWGVKMMLAAIVQLVFWILGIIAHSQGLQRLFQANTVRDKKVFSNFTLGKFIIEFDKLTEIKIDFEKIPQILQQELAHA